jgi:hypothetical protein
MKTTMWAAIAAGLALTLGFGGTQAQAGEIVGGFYAHDTGEAHRENGFDTLVEYRTDRVQWLKWIWKPQVHVLLLANSKVNTNEVAAGFSWAIPLGGSHFYVRPGIGLAYTSGKAGLPPVNAPGISPSDLAGRLRLYNTRKDFGSHELFEPELAVGYRISPRWSAELSYVHFSNGQIFHHGENQGLDDIGLRLAYRFGGR